MVQTVHRSDPKGGNMASKFIGTVLLVGSLFGASAWAGDDLNYLTVGSVELKKISTDVLNQEVSETVMHKNFNHQVEDLPGLPDKAGQLNVDNAGKVIGLARELVALGEDIYRLVQKGKPVNKTSYAPISVIPRQGNGYVDVMDTEGWKSPSGATYQIIYKNLYGMEVVKFRYSVIFSYGGSYQGKGAYITAAQIVPVSIETLFGYTFTATMKLNGIQNHGTSANPVAGAILAMEYTVETVIKASLETDSYHITGRGGFTQL